MPVICISLADQRKNIGNPAVEKYHPVERVYGGSEGIIRGSISAPF
jgi:hypothetical protein